MTAPAFHPSPVSPYLYDLLAAEGLGRDLFHPRQHECCERVEDYVVRLAVHTLAAIGAVPAPGEPADLGLLVARGGVVDAFLARLSWLLELLAAFAVLRRDGDRYALDGPLPLTDLTALRTAALAVDSRYAPTYEMLDEAAALYPRVARGETTAEPALLGRPRLWVRYFANSNPYYALGNHVAARTAAALLAPRARVLEIGGGLGSSAEALLEALAAREAPAASYLLTDPVPFFRRRAERSLHVPSGTRLAVAALDMNAPWGAQGIAAESYDLVWGVNAFHLARDQRAVLAEAWRALRPGGVFVMGEGLRRRPDAPEPAEFPFQLLESFHAVRLGPHRPRPGFPHPDDVVATLTRAGFADVRVVPDLERLRPYYAGFFGGAVSGRRPSPRAASSPT